MNRSAVRWLYEELPALVRDGVLSAEAAERLRARYGDPTDDRRARSMASAVFGTLGALLVGAGVILLLAHNWNALSRPMRAGLAIGLLAAAQGLVAWVLARRADRAGWREASASLLVLAFAASTAVVSQTYHVGGDLGSFLFSWLCLTLPIPYLTATSTPAALWWIALPAWSAAAAAHLPGNLLLSSLLGWGASDVAAAESVLLWPLIAAATPLLLRAGRDRGRDPRAGALLWIAALALPWAIAPTLAGARADLAFACLAAGLASYRWIDSRQRTGGAGAFGIVGAAGIAGLSLTLTFPVVWPDSLPGIGDAYLGVARGASVTVLFAAGIAAAVAAVRGADRRPVHETILGVFFPVVLGGLALSAAAGSSFTAALAFDGYALVLGIAALLDGWRSLRMGTANGGLLLVAAVVLVRFLDAEWSFVARGLAFVAAGLAFLAVNLRLIRRRREAPR